MKIGRCVRSFFYWIPASILWLLNIRFPIFFVNRIGHLLAEPDCFIKEQQLGLRSKCRAVMLASERDVPNKAILEYWSKYFWVVTSRHWVKLLRPFTRNRMTKADVSNYVFAINETATFPTVQRLWGNRRPLLQITAEDNWRGKAALKVMGVPEGAWYVCVHSREGGYSPSDEYVHSYRNSNFSDYMLAVNYIISLGGWCIRMGDPSMAPIPSIDGLIDYANHPSRADWLDFYLAANCKFYLGNSSGAFLMASLFGRPVACANMTPLGAVYPYGIMDIGIPKLYKELSSGRILSFHEVMESPVSNFRLASEFNDAGFEIIDNSPEDIRDLAMEQLERIDHVSFSYSQTDEELQKKMRQLFRVGHYTHGSASRVGRAFLQKYAHLLV